jgi:hypothetical protein
VATPSAWQPTRAPLIAIANNPARLIRAAASAV